MSDPYLIRKNALATISNPESYGHAYMCAKDVLEMLEEVAVLRSQLKAKDEQIAEMSALWQQIRKLEAA